MVHGDDDELVCLLPLVVHHEVDRPGMRSPARHVELVLLLGNMDSGRRGFVRLDMLWDRREGRRVGVASAGGEQRDGAYQSDAKCSHTKRLSVVWLREMRPVGVLAGVSRNNVAETLT